jgi:hypothetical protein
MKFIQLTDANDDKASCINLDFVWYIRRSPGEGRSNNNTTVYFGEDHRVRVTETFDEVAKKLAD